MSYCRIGWAAGVVLALSWPALARPQAAGEPGNLSLVWQRPGQYLAVQVVGNYCYTGETDLFMVYDVANPSSPVQLGNLRLPYGWVHGLDLRGNLAYIANDGLKIVDVTNPSSPTLRGSYPTRAASSVSVSNNLAYVADWDAGLKIIDVTNPSSPTLRGTYDPGIVWDVFVSGSLAYLAAGSGGLQVVDVANPSSPTLRGSYSDPLGGRIRNVFVTNGVAYVTATTGDFWAGYYGRFLSIDVTNPGAPRLLGSYGTSGAGAGIYVSGRFAYVILGNGLRVLDVSLPSVPRLRGFYPTGSIGEGDESQAFVAGDLVYVAADYRGFMILRFTPPPAAANRWQLYR